MTYALDSNTISNILRKNIAAMQRWRREELNGNRVVIPLIVYYEVRRGLLAKDAKRQTGYFNDLCEALGIQDLTIADMNIAAQIYSERKRAGKPIEDTDLLIAAQCIANGFTLVTNNTKHFVNIDGLKMVDWLQE